MIKYRQISCHWRLCLSRWDSKFDLILWLDEEDRTTSIKLQFCSGPCRQEWINEYMFVVTQ